MRGALEAGVESDYWEGSYPYFCTSEVKSVYVRGILSAYERNLPGIWAVSAP